VCYNVGGADSTHRVDEIYLEQILKKWCELEPTGSG